MCYNYYFLFSITFVSSVTLATCSGCRVRTSYPFPCWCTFRGAAAFPSYKRRCHDALACLCSCARPFPEPWAATGPACVHTPGDNYCPQWSSPRTAERDPRVTTGLQDGVAGFNLSEWTGLFSGWVSITFLTSGNTENTFHRLSSGVSDLFPPLPFPDARPVFPFPFVDVLGMLCTRILCWLFVDTGNVFLQPVTCCYFQSFYGVLRHRNFQQSNFQWFPMWFVLFVFSLRRLPLPWVNNVMSPSVFLNLQICFSQLGLDPSQSQGGIPTSCSSLQKTKWPHTICTDNTWVFCVYKYFICE